MQLFTAMSQVVCGPGKSEAAVAIAPQREAPKAARLFAF
jgi:hypothetical protein